MSTDDALSLSAIARGSWSLTLPTPIGSTPSDPAPTDVAATDAVTAVPSLARRMTRRAIDLFVISFLIVVGLSTGQQLIEWWRVDPASAPEPPMVNPVDLDWNRTPVTIQFGSASTSLERMPFAGGRKQLDEELTRLGKAIVTTTEIVPSVMEEAERDWLEALQAAPPVFWDSTRGNVYRRHEPLPSFVATRFNEQSGNDLITQRIVGWGLAFPTAPGEWTIYVFHPRSAKSAQAESTARIGLPPGAQNITSLEGSDDCQWRVFQGRGDIAGWVQHFEEQLGTGALVSRDISENSANLKYRRERTLSDIQIRRERDGRLTGVIWSAPERE